LNRFYDRRALTDFFSDTKKIPLDKVTKQFFFLAARYFSCNNIFLTARKKSCAKEKLLGQGKKNCFVTSSRGIFLASEKNSECVFKA